VVAVLRSLQLYQRASTAMELTRALLDALARVSAATEVTLALLTGVARTSATIEVTRVTALLPVCAAAGRDRRQGGLPRECRPADHGLVVSPEIAPAPSVPGSTSFASPRAATISPTIASMPTVPSWALAGARPATAATSRSAWCSTTRASLHRFTPLWCRPTSRTPIGWCGTGGGAIPPDRLHGRRRGCAATGRPLPAAAVLFRGSSR
jgi:hypothetical protein